MRFSVSLLTAILIAGATQAILGSWLGVLGFVPSILAFVTTFVLVNRFLKDPAKLPPDFKAHYGHDNIAIDMTAGRVWLRDRHSRRVAVIERHDVLRWTHRYTQSNGCMIRNFIDVEVRDLDRPKYEVSFDRHGDTWKWNARRNAAECEEWQSRLTTWINNT